MKQQTFHCTSVTPVSIPMKKSAVEIYAFKNWAKH